MGISPQRSEQPVEAVEGGHPVGLGHGGVVEGGIDEVVDGVARPLLGHDRLADVDDLRGVVPQAVDAEDLPRVPVEEQLEHAHRAAGDLRARQALEEGMADLVGHVLMGELLLGAPQAADLRAGVDAAGDVLHQLVFQPPLDDVGGGEAALIIRGAGQRGDAHHVSHRVDVGHDGLVRVVHLHVAARVGLDAQLVEPHVVGVAGAPVGPQEDLRLEPLAALEVQHHPVVGGLHALHLLLVADEHALFAQVVGERIGDLIVQEGQEPVARVDQIHLHPEHAEHGRVLAADDARPIDEHRHRRLVHREDGVRVEDARVGEVQLRWAVGARARGDDEGLGGQQLAGAPGIGDFQRVGIQEAPVADGQLHAVSLVEGGAQLHLARHHRRGLAHHVLELRDLGQLHAQLGVIILHVHQALNGVAERLGGDGGGMGAGAAHQHAVVHHANALALLGRLHGSAFSPRPRTNHHDVEMPRAHGRILLHLGALGKKSVARVLARSLRMRPRGRWPPPRGAPPRPGAAPTGGARRAGPPAECPRASAGTPRAPCPPRRPAGECRPPVHRWLPARRRPGAGPPSGRRGAGPARPGGDGPSPGSKQAAPGS
ncbi:hypothetical protein STIAU_6500 [Stigmatella aurantiaca DW4/3-1]|uniref:Uncharacterized protein n=1 Tax=Stigmatella aurantiaca (strain DW4/3-1) TaxID=378806 RepID=Q08YR8_STIAD|nr:hypothetical protein STIAU_6500 [Stigmatella aurantiaca DW4/3-1]